MNRNTTFTFKEVIYIIISLIITCIFLFFITDNIIELARKGANWLDPTIGTLGNLGGGIIGGIVAYIVAAYQVKKGIEVQEKDKLKNLYSLLRLIKEEIDYNLDVLGSVFPYENTPQYNSLIDNHLQNIQWLNCSPNLGPELDSVIFTRLCSFYQQVMALKSPDKTHVSSDLIEAAKTLASTTVIELDTTINDLKNKI